MGDRTLTISGTDYPIHVIRNFESVSSITDNRSRLLVKNYANDPQSWTLARPYAQRAVNLIDGDQALVESEEALPDTVIAMFDGIRKGRKPLWQSRSAWKNSLQRKVEKLLESSTLIDSIFVRVRDHVLDDSNRLEVEWLSELRKLPMYRLDMPKGALVLPAVGVLLDSPPL